MTVSANQKGATKNLLKVAIDMYIIYIYMQIYVYNYIITKIARILCNTIRRPMPIHLKDQDGKWVERYSTNDIPL